MRLLVLWWLPLLASAEFAVTAQLFQLGDGQALNNVKLSWNLVAGAANYTVFRMLSDDDFTSAITSSPGNSVDIYDLKGPATFQIHAFTNTSVKLDMSGPGQVLVAPDVTANTTLQTFDNTRRSPLRVRSNIRINDTFYRYNYVGDRDGFLHFVEQTSEDGYKFIGDKVVLTRETVCASTEKGTCKLESIKWQQHPVTKEAVMWGHFENNMDYKLAKVAAAYGVPGQGNLSFSGAFRPAGDDSRDSTVFVDLDGKAYLISAVKMNTDLALYALDDAWRNVSSKVATLMPGQRREAPAMVHADGYYYLFTSTANGWYPSEGKYISARSLTGPWTQARNIGNTINFGAQSGGIVKIGHTYLQVANRWAAQWVKPEVFNRQIVLPIAFNKGVAQYNFYRTLRYSDEQGLVIPVQNGRIVSVNKPVVASSGKHPEAAADGTQTDPKNIYTPDAVPFWWQVDLGELHTITQIDITPRVVTGSDTYMQYKIEASTEGQMWTVIADQSSNLAPGFQTNSWDHIGDPSMYRHVRVRVGRIVNIHTGANANWAAGLHEVLVYGMAGSSNSTASQNVIEDPCKRPSRSPRV